MLIHCSPQAVTNGALKLPAWIRAPINLVEGAIAYVAFHSENRIRLPALIVSPYHHDSWSDLWSIKLEIEDEQGRLAQLYSLFAELGIRVLSAESSTMYAGRSHALAFVCDCRSYQTTSDLSEEDRKKRSYCQLRGLYSKLSTEFLDVLVFANGRHPSLRIRRMNAYHQCFRDLGGVRAVLSTPERVQIANRELAIPRLILEQVIARLGTNQFDAIATTDTTSRMLHVLFSSTGSALLSLRVYVRNTSSNLKGVFGAINQAGFNTHRYQLRPGVIRPRTGFVVGEPEVHSTITAFIQHREPGVSLENLKDLLNTELGKVLEGTKGVEWDFGWTQVHARDGNGR